MKTNLIILAFLLCIYSHRAMANNEDTIPVYKNELRFGVYQLFQQALYVSYERFYKNTSTVLSQEITYLNSKSRKISGYYILLEQRINLYNSKDYPYSVYLAPGIKYRYKDINDTDYHDIINIYGMQITGGLKLIFYSRFTIDMQFGATLQTSEIDTERISYNYDDNYLSPGYSGIAPIFNMTFGFKF
ncbi:MAG: hypothetical protein JXB00_06440 [Bacteroidales bacterium]|nr:hypothetical protein [Bacteroidales bacterium]